MNRREDGWWQVVPPVFMLVVVYAARAAGVTRLPTWVLFAFMGATLLATALVGTVRDLILSRRTRP
jgi:hypothetical protein